jgi:hypothetical protein
MDPAVLARRHRLDGEADESGGRRVGAVRRIRHEHRLAGRALAFRVDGGLDRHHAEELAMGAGLGREGDGGHAGERREIARELAHELERALHGRDRLERMDVADARQPRHALVEARIVLHGAGAEWEEPGVDAEILLGQAHIVAHGLGLGEARQADPTLALELAEAVREWLGLVEIDPGRVVAADLEDQRLLLLEGAVAGEGGVVGCALARSANIPLEARGFVPHPGRRIGGAVSLGCGGSALAVQHQTFLFKASARKPTWPGVGISKAIP